MAFSGSLRLNKAPDKGRPAAQERVRRPQRRRRLSSKPAFDSGKTARLPESKVAYCYCVRTNLSGRERTIPPVSVLPAPPPPPPLMSPQEERLISRATT